MQPVFPYRALSYPPRGSMWPTFGDDVLAKTLTVTEEAHHYLNEKRKMMNDFHQDNLDYHGLQPKKAPETFDMTDDADAPMESSTAEAGTQMEGQATAGMGTQTQRRPLQMQTGVAASQAPETASTDTSANMEVDREGPPKKTMTYQRGVAAASQAPEKKKLAYQKGVAASIDPAADMEDDRETVNYAEEDMDTSSALEVDDHEMQVPAASRKRGAAPEEKKVKKLKPQVQAQTVKTEGQAARLSQAAGDTPRLLHPRLLQPSLPRRNWAMSAAKSSHSRRSCSRYAVTITESSGLRPSSFIRVSVAQAGTP
jgi:hypothetical protein